jgi:tripartite-type tricarboxylate transporter receptor subunit TctC
MKFLTKANVRLMGATALLALSSLSATAQTYPNKAITLVVPFAAGGPTDLVARLLGATMTRTLGQPVVVENRAGAGGTVASNYVAKAAADGYTFLIHHNGMATAPSLYRKLPFNPLTDFEYVSQVIDVPMTLVGRKDLPPNDFKELVTYLRANGNKINLAHAGLGAVSSVQRVVSPGHWRGVDHHSVFGHGPGHERAAGWPG